MMFEGILILLKLASLAARWLNERRFFKAGQQDQLAKTIAEVAEAAGVAKEVRKEVDQMTNDELVQELMR